MPSRIIRDGILSSARVASIVEVGGWEAEVFYRRLHQIVDDHGRHEADPRVLRPKMYPLALELMREANVSRCLMQCQAAGLVRLYSVGGKQYLQVEDFKQRARTDSKCPPPPPVPDTTVDSPPATAPPDLPDKCPSHDSQMRAQAYAHSKAHAQSLAVDAAGGRDGLKAEAERQAESHSFARAWVNERWGPGSHYVTNGTIWAMAKLVALIGKDRAVAEVELADADPDVGNPCTTVWSRYDPGKKNPRQRPGATRPAGKPVTKVVLNGEV